MGGALLGCAGLGGWEPQAAEVVEQGRAEERPGYSYGHGVAETRAAARQAALYEIAGEVVTAIRGEEREVFRSLERRGGSSGSGSESVERISERAYSSTVASTSHVILEGATVEAEQQVAEGWYARARIPDRRMAALRERAEEQAPALAQLERVEAVPEQEPGRRFVRAERGHRVVQQLGLGGERAYSPQLGETTFRAYFEEMARRAAGRIEAVPVVEEGALRFVIVDGESLRPQPGLQVRVGGWTFRTDDEGWTGRVRRGRLPERAEVAVMGAPDGPQSLPDEVRKAGTLAPGEWDEGKEATLYVYTQPADAIVRIRGVDYATPARASVRRGRAYRLRIPGTDSYRSESGRVEVDEGSPAAYYAAELTERAFGSLDLATEGGSAVLRLERHGGWEGEALQRPAEAGRYRVRVTREDPRYQDVIDELVLRPDERIYRRYHELPSRDPYYYGWRWAVTLGTAGGEPVDGYKVPGDAGGVPYAERAAAIDAARAVERDAEASSDLGLQGQYFADMLPVTAAASVGYRETPYAVMPASAPRGGAAAEVQLATMHASAGAGLWWPMGPALGWLTAHQAWAQSRWDDQDAAINMPGGSAANSYPFLELGTHWGWGMLTARLAGDEAGVAPQVTLGLGPVMMRHGYRRPAEVSARPGVHYE